MKRVCQGTPAGSREWTSPYRDRRRRSQGWHGRGRVVGGQCIDRELLAELALTKYSCTLDSLLDYS